MSTMAATSAVAVTTAGDECGGVSIRYGCKCGHLEPIDNMFFSEMCHKPVCRLPRCSVEEFEAYYCGYLLVNMPSKEASMYQNRSSRCFSCVSCGNVLSTVLHEALQKYFFLCSHCRWDSLTLDLVEDDPDMLIMSTVAREREAAQEDIFHTMLSHYLTANASNRGSAIGTGVSRASSSSGIISGGRSSSLQLLADSMKELQREQQMKKFRAQRMTEMGTWKLEQALDRMQEKEQWLLEQRRLHVWPDLQQQLDRIVPAPDPVAKDRQNLEQAMCATSMDNISTLSQRLANPLEQPRDAGKLFPPRPLLRVKRTWRCVESIEKGSAGILVKPQISPMSGDSSMPIAASWFKKANLAVHYLPIFTFQTLPRKASNNSAGAATVAAGKVVFEFVLLVENPLDEVVRIVVKTPSTDAIVEHNAKLLLTDSTPIQLGPFEDPNIAEAFVSDSATAQAQASWRNILVVSSKRNLERLKIQVQASPHAQSLRFGLQVDMEKYDIDLEEAIENSSLSFPVEFKAPVLA
ncbi:TPA: hypothetical protein N0F65_002812 [Lagenidium giganteum]|uniref:Dynactin subunit 4 n=1 Tax=Lagenidium giganteum TaxID=4803 RepID=A0AAV2ZDQ2_9STRA|nr:TPA: hypothetical protein N0F65_002812 [Lagenidium giganteum]